MKYKIKRNDTVKVIAGKEKGRQARFVLYCVMITKLLLKALIW